MTDREKKNKIADILLDFYDEYDSNVINRPMIPNIYVGKILDSLQEESVSDDLEDFALQYAGHHAPYDDCMQEVVDAVKAGAQWQKQKDKQPINDDLEEAAKNHAAERYRTTRDRELAEKCKWSFKAGAKWKEKKDEKELQSHKVYKMGKQAGMRYMKQLMMKDAKSGTVQEDYQIILDDGAYIDLDPSMSLKPSFAVKAGERVKMVIIKQEEE